MYKLFISRIFYLIFSDHGWPWVTETMESGNQRWWKTAALLLTILLRNLKLRKFKWLGHDNIAIETWVIHLTWLILELMLLTPMLFCYTKMSERRALRILPCSSRTTLDESLMKIEIMLIYFIKLWMQNWKDSVLSLWIDTLVNPPIIHQTCWQVQG